MEDSEGWWVHGDPSRPYYEAWKVEEMRPKLEITRPQIDIPIYTPSPPSTVTYTAPSYDITPSKDYISSRSKKSSRGVAPKSEKRSRVHTRRGVSEWSSALLYLLIGAVCGAGMTLSLAFADFNEFERFVKSLGLVQYRVGANKSLSLSTKAPQSAKDSLTSGLLYRVAENDLKLRSSAGTSQKIITKLPYGTQVLVNSARIVSVGNFEWVEVVTKDDQQTGWVAFKFIERISE